MSDYKIKKVVLRKLIKEVLSELDEVGGDNVMQHSLDAKEHAGNVIIKMEIRGIKPNKGLKRAMAAMAYAARVADLEVIHGEVSRGDQKLVTMDDSELKSASSQLGHNDNAFAKRAAPKINMAKLSPEERLAMMKDGEKEQEWKDATNNDMIASREKQKLKKQKMAAGTYDRNDTTLWTDKEWDAYNILVTSEGAPLDNTTWDEEQWESFNHHVGGDEEGKWAPSHTKKTAKLANVGAGLGNLKH